jgi:hypothetical protein
VRKRFEMLEVMRALGTAPSTSSIIAGLMNGDVDPENFKSVEFWAFSTLDAPPMYRSVLSAVAELLHLDEEDVKVVKDFEGRELWYLAGYGGQPTVTWHEGEFVLRAVDE